MVEAVCLLPVLCLLWLSVIHLERLHLTHHDVAQRTRECALRHARTGCDPEASMPEHCANAFTSITGSDAEARGIFDRDLAQSVDGSGAQTSLFDGAAKLPVLGPAIEGLFGRGRVARLTASVAGTAGRKLTRVSAAHHILCDVRPSTAGDVAGQIFDLLNPL